MKLRSSTTLLILALVAGCAASGDRDTDLAPAADLLPVATPDLGAPIDYEFTSLLRSGTNASALWSGGDGLFVVGSADYLLHSGDDGQTFDLPMTTNVPNAASFADVWGDGAGSVWVVGNGGLVAHSTDHGATFTGLTSPAPQGSFMHVVEVGGAVVIQAADAIYRSTDEGATWAAEPLPVTNDASSLLAFGDVVLVGGDRGSIARSSDDGATFTTGQLAAGTTASVVGLARIGATTYASSDDGLFASGDDGVTWVQETTNNAGWTSLVESGSTYYSASALGLFTSSDVATGWTGVLPGFSGHGWATTYDAATGSTFLGAQNGLLVRIDSAGALDVLASGQYIRDAWMSPNGTLYASTINSSGLLKSTDLGQTWTVLAGGGMRGGLWGTSDGDFWSAGNATLWHTSDGGLTWATRDLSGHGSGYDHIWSPPGHAEEMYLSGRNSDVLHSSDGGQSFTTALPGLNSASYGYFSGTADDVWVTEVGLGPTHSTDRGATWQTVTFASSTQCNNTFQAGATLFCVGQGGLIMRSTDGGASWTQHDSGVTVGLLDGWAAAANDIYVVGQTYLLRSTDLGDTWTKVQASGDLKDYARIVGSNSGAPLILGDAGTILLGHAK